MPKPLPTIVETAAYQLACASRKFDPARLERARDLLIDPRTTVLPDGTIDFPSETAGFRVLPLVGDGQLKFCDFPTADGFIRGANTTSRGCSCTAPARCG